MGTPIYYDFSAAVNGVGTPADPRNTWATPINNQDTYIRRGNIFARNTQLNFSTFINQKVDSWFYADGSDEPNLPKPIITIQLTTTSTSAINVQGAGVHIFKNIVFRDIYRVGDPTTRINGLTFGTQGTYGVDPGVSGEIWDCEFYNIAGNAANFNGNNSASTPNLAADRMRVMDCVFDNIGEDCIFGQAKDCEIAYNRMTRMSMNSENGDGVGLLYFNPTKCWIHHNYIDHRDTDFKHCIIVDGTNSTGTCLIEDNELYGINTVGINIDECQGTARRNTIYTQGIGFSTNTDNVHLESNTFIVDGFRNDTDNTVGLSQSNGRCNNNTFIVNKKIPTAAVITTGSGRSGNTFQNNIIIGAACGYRSGTGSTYTSDKNLFIDVDAPYVDNAYMPVAIGGTDIVSDVLSVNADGTLKADSEAIGAGVFLGWKLDCAGKQFYNPPSIGAYEYERPRISRT